MNGSTSILALQWWLVAKNDRHNLNFPFQLHCHPLNKAALS
jgi:hypothetical protein